MKLADPGNSAEWADYPGQTSFVVYVRVTERQNNKPSRICSLDGEFCNNFYMELLTSQALLARFLDDSHLGPLRLYQRCQLVEGAGLSITQGMTAFDRVLSNVRNTSDEWPRRE